MRYNALVAAVLRVPPWVFDGHVLTAVTHAQHIQVARRLQQKQRRGRHQTTAGSACARSVGGEKRGGT